MRQGKVKNEKGKCDLFKIPDLGTLTQRKRLLILTQRTTEGHCWACSEGTVVVTSVGTA